MPPLTNNVTALRDVAALEREDDSPLRYQRAYASEPERSYAETELDENEEIDGMSVIFTNTSTEEPEEEPMEFDDFDEISIVSDITDFGLDINVPQSLEMDRKEEYLTEVGNILNQAPNEHTLSAGLEEMEDNDADDEREEEEEEDSYDDEFGDDWETEEVRANQREQLWIEEGTREIARRWAQIYGPHEVENDATPLHRDLTREPEATPMHQETDVEMEDHFDNGWANHVNDVWHTAEMPDEIEIDDEGGSESRNDEPDQPRESLEVDLEESDDEDTPAQVKESPKPTPPNPSPPNNEAEDEKPPAGPTEGTADGPDLDTEIDTRDQGLTPADELRQETLSQQGRSPSRGRSRVVMMEEAHKTRFHRRSPFEGRPSQSPFAGEKRRHTVPGGPSGNDPRRSRDRRNGRESSLSREPQRRRTERGESRNGRISDMTTPDPRIANFLSRSATPELQPTRPNSTHFTHHDRNMIAQLGDFTQRMERAAGENMQGLRNELENMADGFGQVIREVRQSQREQQQSVEALLARPSLILPPPPQAIEPRINPNTETITIGAPEERPRTSATDEVRREGPTPAMEPLPSAPLSEVVNALPVVPPTNLQASTNLGATPQVNLASAAAAVSPPVETTAAATSPPVGTAATATGNTATAGEITENVSRFLLINEPPPIVHNPVNLSAETANAPPGDRLERLVVALGENLLRPKEGGHVFDVQGKLRMPHIKALDLVCRHDVDEWLLQFEWQCRSQEIPQRQWYSCLMNRINVDSRPRVVSAPKECLGSYRAMSDWIAIHFGPEKPFQEYRNQLRAMAAQRLSIPALANAISRIWTKYQRYQIRLKGLIPLTDDELTQTLMDGLEKTEDRRWVLEKRSQDWAYERVARELTIRIQHGEVAQHGKTLTTTMYKFAVDDPITGNVYGGQVGAMAGPALRRKREESGLNEEKRQPSNEPPRREARMPSEEMKRKFGSECRNCGRMGHWKNECRSPRRSSSNNDSRDRYRSSSRENRPDSRDRTSWRDRRDSSRDRNSSRDFGRRWRSPTPGRTDDRRVQFRENRDYRRSNNNNVNGSNNEFDRGRSPAASHATDRTSSQESRHDDQDPLAEHQPIVGSAPRARRSDRRDGRSGSRTRN